MTEKLYNKYKNIQDGDLTKFELEIKRNGYRMTEELVDEILKETIDKDGFYYWKVSPELTAADGYITVAELTTTNWDGYDIECIAEHYAEFKERKWIDAIDELTANDIDWNEDNDIDDVSQKIIWQFWKIEEENRSGWLKEFKKRMQLNKDDKKYIDISDCQ